MNAWFMLLATPLLTQDVAPKAPPRPNVIVVLADDLGYGDPQCYNPASKIPTPAMDRLAAEGMRFTDAHSPSSVCTPTRYGLLTGRYCWRTPLKKSVLWRWDPPLLEDERITLPELLQSAGYRTACIGKWHLGWDWPLGEASSVTNEIEGIQWPNAQQEAIGKRVNWDRPIAGGPLEHGFDSYFGDDVPNFPPYTWIENDRVVVAPTETKPQGMFGAKGPAAPAWDLRAVLPTLQQRATDFIDQHVESADSRPFFLYLSLTSPHTPIAPSPEWNGKSQAGAYGDFVAQTDGVLAAVLDTLDRHDLAEETLILFTSDNGSPQRDGTNWSGAVGSVKAKFGHDPSAPWRGVKADIWEGGHRVPLLVRWPEVLAAGTERSEPWIHTDLYRTLAGLLRLEVAAGQATDSLDQSPHWTAAGNHPPVREVLVHHSHQGVFAIRHEHWKLILGKSSGGFTRWTPPEDAPPGQLYHLGEDPQEQNNVYRDYPEVVQQLTATLDEIREQEADPTVDYSRFETTTLASGLDRPMELTVAPDGRVFWIELAGKLRIFDPSTGTIEEAGTLDVFVEQENGLLGIALAPDFLRSQQIYLLYSPPDYPGQNLSRFRMHGNRLDLESEQLILKFEEQRRECCHHAGSLEFDAHGNLFIATGDNTHPHGDSQGFAPLDEREGRSPWDAQKGPANTQSLSGKILRIRPTADGYEIPAGNLFTDPEQGRPEIYVMGCRNPWRIGVDQKTGYVYWGDVGPDAGGDGPRGPRGYDEINQARQAGNFGWPYLIADNQAYHDVDFETGEVGEAYDAAGPTNASPNNTGARVLPPAQPAWIYYPYGDSDRFPELNAPGGRTACAGPIYDFDADLDSATQFPAYFDRCFFAFEWSRHWITAVHLDEDSNIERLERFLPDRPFKRPVDLEFGPEGSLYLLEYGTTWGTNEDSALVRIDYFAGNRAPRAEITLSNAIGTAPLTVAASAAGTVDPDGDSLEYVWRIASSKEVLSREAEPTLTFEEEGVFQLELEVTDPSGARASAISPVLVGNSPPRIAIDTPRDGDFFQPGQPIAWQVTASDPEDGNAAQKSELAARVAMEVQWHDGALPGTLGAANTATQPGREAMKRSDCFNCHALDRKVIGPTLLEIAGKYREQEGALERLAQRVREGSSGVWGQVPMLPHPQHSDAEAKQMVSWILGLTQDGPKLEVQRGLSGSLPADQQGASLLLTASYTDLGSAAIPPLTASAQVRLRHPAMEAEHFHAHAGNQVLNSSTASGGSFIGAITAGSHLRFDQIDLRGMERVSLRVSSAGEGGFIELRRGSKDGPLLARTEVVPNGAWEDWYEIELPLTPSQGQSPLFVLFVNPKGGGGLMNLDRISFLRPGQALDQLLPPE